VTTWRPTTGTSRSDAVGAAARLAAGLVAWAGLVLWAACAGEDENTCPDLDGDGYGSYIDPGCLFAGIDCDDGDPWVNPGAQEVCGNGTDDNCFGGDDPCNTSRCRDADGDTYGEGPLCRGPDCNDSNPAIRPGAGEICGDGIDNDCYGGDRECPPACVDGDGDGYGTGAGCWGPDCDDFATYVNPGAVELCGDGIDNDCVGGDEVCRPQCGDGWLSLGTTYGNEMGWLGDVISPDPDLGTPWILLSSSVIPGSSATVWVGWGFDAALAACVTDLSVFVYAFDDSTLGNGANISFDAGDGTAGDLISNVDRDEMWYGAVTSPAGHLDCDADFCWIWLVLTAEALDYTHIREAEVAIYLDAF
jgi:hypothetical protein